MWKEQIQSILEGLIEMHILDDPPIKMIDSPEGQKISVEYADWKKDDSLIKS